MLGSHLVLVTLYRNLQLELVTISIIFSVLHVPDLNKIVVQTIVRQGKKINVYAQVNCHITYALIVAIDTKTNCVKQIHVTTFH